MKVSITILPEGDRKKSTGEVIFWLSLRRRRKKVLWRKGATAQRFRGTKESAVFAKVNVVQHGWGLDCKDSS